MNIVALIFLMALMIAPSAISENDDENLWVVSFGLYSGRPSPRIYLNQSEIDKVQNMIAIGLQDAVNLASDDPKPHQGETLYDSDLGGKTFFNINIMVESVREKRLLRLYPIVGRYLRIYSDDGKSSKLYKMKNAEIEKYLVNLGILKGALNLAEQSEILSIINQRKE